MEASIEESGEHFDDFLPADGQEQQSSEISKILQKELTETEEFKEEFDDVLAMSDDPKAALTEQAVQYVQASCDADEVNLVSYSKRNNGAINGWGFKGDEDQTYVDLFITVYKDPSSGSKISKSDIEKQFAKLQDFFNGSVQGNTLAGLYYDTDIYQIARLINDTGKIDRLRLFFLTNAIAPAGYDPDNTELESGTTVEYHIWDARRIMQQDHIQRGVEPVIVDFDSDYNSPLPFIKMPDVSDRVECYLTIIPGTVLAQIYHRYHQQILEQNVRTFLQFKGASNKGIRDTLIGHKPTPKQLEKGDQIRAPEPDMFFAYNNGISTTAKKVDVMDTGSGPVITRITDWQIVNGGQTTASISTVMGMKDVDKTALARVYVSMKVSVLKNAGNDSERDKDIVSHISKYANTQSAVKKSDFNINEPFLVELEQISRKEWVKDSGDRPVSKWFFERTRGQYQDKLNHCATAAAEKEFEAEYPKSQMFDKTMLAKYMMAWYQDPSSVCNGGEINYQKFYTKLHREAYHFDERKYHQAIAKAVLFNTIDAYYGKDGKQLLGYKSNMVAYTLAALSYLSGKSLDLSRIWDEQHVLSSSVMSELTITVPSVYAKLVNGDEHVSYKVKIETRGDDGKRHKHYETRDIPPEELEKLRATALYRVMLFVKDIEPVIWDVLVAGVKAGENTNSWTKRLGCWDALKATLSEKDLKFPQDVISSAGDSDEEITDGQQRKIEEMRKVPADVWFSINKWAKETLLLTPRETAFIGQMGYRIKRGFGVTYKQAKWAMDLYEKAQTKGWSDDR
jgi:hypothetical protein